MAYVAAQLGNSVAICEKYYGHIEPGHVAEVMDRLRTVGLEERKRPLARVGKPTNGPRLRENPVKPLPHRAEECEPPETRTAQAIRAVREHVAAQAAAKQNPADRAREQLAELHEAIEQSRRRFSSFFSKAERDALTSAQRTRIAKIAETFLGPFARTSTKQQCDEDVTCLVLVARQNRPRRRSGDDIRALKRTASRFDGAAKEAKTLSKKLKDKLAKWEVNVDALAVQLDGSRKLCGERQRHRPPSGRKEYAVVRGPSGKNNCFCRLQATM